MMRGAEIPEALRGF